MKDSLSLYTKLSVMATERMAGLTLQADQAEINGFSKWNWKPMGIAYGYQAIEKKHLENKCLIFIQQLRNPHSRLTWDQTSTEIFSCYSFHIIICNVDRMDFFSLRNTLYLRVLYSQFCFPPFLSVWVADAIHPGLVTKVIPKNQITSSSLSEANHIGSGDDMNKQSVLKRCARHWMGRPKLFPRIEVGAVPGCVFLWKICWTPQLSPNT